ncbi:uncharacterized protein EI90DRAFT_3055332 [Cantharellus anzutake]|uniref:uncharacterized protein n=1 Tax=Cantharellus anzutake TaxID=1750568 RepID=UPI0019044F59|nr:uncharacterized protein EI90DRAFT_3055332 [Cantharellus anzutake]KAF8332364.1 hypothetical protein EI90DRAFT_3055332 [Cantharellus anzutake]
MRSFVPSAHSERVASRQKGHFAPLTCVPGRCDLPQVPFGFPSGPLRSPPPRSRISGPSFVELPLLPSCAGGEVQHSDYSTKSGDSTSWVFICTILCATRGDECTNRMASIGSFSSYRSDWPCLCGQQIPIRVIFAENAVAMIQICFFCRRGITVFARYCHPQPDQIFCLALVLNFRSLRVLGSLLRLDFRSQGHLVHPGSRPGSHTPSLSILGGLAWTP